MRHIAIITCIAVLAVILRFHQYAEFPVVGETADEYAWTFLGSSLIEQGVPASWSQIDAYKRNQRTDLKVVDQLGQRYPMVQPVFDHPPLFALLPGIAQALRYDQWYEVPSAKVIRLPMLLLGVLNIVLLYFVAKKITQNNRVAALSALVLATAPHFVFASRLVVAENGLATISLLAMLVTASVRSIKRVCFLVGLLSAVAVLIKMSGIVICLSLIVLGVATKQYKMALSALLGTVTGFALFAIYGWWYNWGLFVDVFLTQSSRGFGLLTLINRWFFHSAIVDKFYSDGWFFLGLIAVFFTMVAVKNKSLLLTHLIVIFNMLFIAFFVGEQTYHGWYDFILIPSFALSIGIVLNQVLTERRYLALGFIWLLLLPMLRYLLLSFGVVFNLNEWIIRLIMVIGFIPYGVSLLPDRGWSQRLAWITICLMLLVNSVTVLMFAKEAYWATDDTIMYRGYIYPDSNNKDNL